MSIRTAALIFGVIYALIGVMGFIPGFLQEVPPNAPDLAVDAGYGYLLGLFPVNIVHNVIHLVVGLLGIVAFRSLGFARNYFRVLTIVFAGLTVLGLIPADVSQTTFGLAPLFSHDIWLHALTTLVAGYFGYLAPAREMERSM